MVCVKLVAPETTAMLRQQGAFNGGQGRAAVRRIVFVETMEADAEVLVVKWEVFECWSRAFGPPLVPGVPRGSFPVYQCPLVVSRTSLLVLSCHTAPLGFPLCSLGALCLFPPAPHGDGGTI